MQVPSSVIKLAPNMATTPLKSVFLSNTTTTSGFYGSFYTGYDTSLVGLVVLRIDTPEEKSR